VARREEVLQEPSGVLLELLVGLFQTRDEAIQDVRQLEDSLALCSFHVEPPAEVGRAVRREDPSLPPSILP